MNDAELRPTLPWRRLVPGTYAAETPTGETYLVEKTDDGWRVVLRGPRGGREILGEPSRIKWVGQCRAENHYLHARKGKLSPEKVPAAAPEAKQRPRRSETAAKPSKPAVTPPKREAKPTRKTAKEPRTSRRHRRAAPPRPPKPKAPIEPLPAHTLAWTAARQNGREYHVAEHEGGLFKILEVKGTEGFALFSERAGGVVQEIQCGSLDACKQTAASLRTGKGNPPKSRSKSGEQKTASFTPTPFNGTHAPPGPDPEALRKLGLGGDDKGKSKAPEVAKAGACECEPPKEKKARKAPMDPAKQSKLVDGLMAALRKAKPPTVKEA